MLKVILSARTAYTLEGVCDQEFPERLYLKTNSIVGPQLIPWGAEYVDEDNMASRSSERVRFSFNSSLCRMRSVHDTVGLRDLWCEIRRQCNPTPLTRLVIGKHPVYTGSLVMLYTEVARGKQVI